MGDLWRQRRRARQQFQRRRPMRRHQRKVKLSVNGHYALTFNLGVSRDFTWREGDYELKYISKRASLPPRRPCT